MNADPTSQNFQPPTFDALPLSPDVRRAVDELGWSQPTPVQLAAFAPASEGRDLVVQARTGTGKTAAFALPLVDRRVRADGGPQALILAPTRELALQSAQEIERIGRHRGIRAVAVYGGAPMERQVAQIRAGAQIVSGTPGRVLDHLRRGTLKGEDLRILVLDEADEMLSMGFARELNAIVDLLPKSGRQTMLFSATLDEAVQRLAAKLLRDPVHLALSSDAVGALGIAHYVYMVSGLGKTRDLVRILEVEDPESAIIFCNTKATTELVATELQQAGFQADWLNGDLPQSEREKVLDRTRRGELRYMVATDVAARGIDISHLTHVINFDFPEAIEAYVHRTGRTGRAGRTGTAISLVTPQDLGSLYYVRLAYKIFPIERTLPSAGELQARRELDRIEMLREAFSAEPREIDRAVARRLLVHDDAEHIVAGLLRTFFGEQDAETDERAAAARRARPAGAVADGTAAEHEARKPAAEGEEVDEAHARSPSNAPQSEPDAARRSRRRRRERPLQREGGDETPPAADSSPAQLAAVSAPADGPPESLEESPAAADTAVEADSGLRTLFLNVGRRDGVRVADVIRLFEVHVGLSKDDLGRIRIRDRHTFVGVPADRVEHAIASLTGKTEHDKQLVVELARAEQARAAPAEPPQDV